MITPMNHREIEYTTPINKENITDIFAAWGNKDEKEASYRLMRWLEETQEQVMQKELQLDYGADCIRLYLMFEKTPKAGDLYFDTWEECSLEGCYKFLGRFRRMLLVASEANQRGEYQKLAVGKLRAKIHLMQKEIMQYIGKGNTMPNRHNAVSVLMEGVKELQRELRIGELVTRIHSQELSEAVPLRLQEKMTETLEEKQENKEVNETLAEITALLAPFAPVLAEHLWQKLKQDGTSVMQCQWREGFDGEAKEALIKLPLQVNAKTKKVLTISLNASKEEAERKARQELSYILEGKDYDIIYVPGKILNFVI